MNRHGAIEAICTACHQETTCVAVDFGIGPTEAWGVWKDHQDWAAVSKCCEAPCTFPSNGREITLRDLEKAYWDYL